MNDPQIDREELASSCGSLVRRLRALARASERRGANEGFREALGRAAEELDGAACSLVEDLETELSSELPEVSARIAERILAAWEKADLGEADAEEQDSPTDAEERVEGSPLAGSSEVFAIPDLIEWLGMLGKTGILQVRGDSERFTIEFRRGRVVHAVSDGTPAGSRLGDLLVERGILSRDELDRFLESAKGSGEPLGAVLEQSEKLSREQLQGALAEQVQRLFLRLFATRRATFAFRQGAMGAREAQLSLSPRCLLFESARLTDEGVAGACAEWNESAA